MKQIVFVFFFSIISIQAFCQYGANGITIHEDPRIQKYLNRYDVPIAIPTTMYIYRIQLVSTYNRDEAYRIQGRYRNLFPGHSSFIKHDGVKFIVRAGSYESRVDAEVALSQLRKNFPSSFILPPEIKQTN